MGRKKTIEERQIEKLTKDFLDQLGRTISVMTARDSKVRTRDLRESQNWRVRPYNVLTVSQNYYGKYNTPKGVDTPKDRDNITNTPLKNNIEKYTPPGVEVFVKDMIDLLKSPIVTK